MNSEVRMNSTTITTPAGPLTVVTTDEGAVRAAAFGAEIADVMAVAGRPGGEPRHRADLGDVSKAVRAYLEGDLAAIDAVPVAQSARGEFVAAAWDALRQTRPGQPVTYTELASRAGRPAAVRAAANACARNAAALFVPCHRVVRSDGGLGGYRWGVEVKRWLLAHEADRWR